jgi:hypothetical protein
MGAVGVAASIAQRLFVIDRESISGEVWLVTRHAAERP